MWVRALNLVGGGGGLPSWLSIHEQTLTESSPTLVVPYDSTRVVNAVYCYDTAGETTRAKAATAQWGRQSYSSDSWIKSAGYTNGSNPPADTATGSYGSMTFDAVNNTITFALRDSSYTFKADATYRTIIIYQED